MGWSKGLAEAATGADRQLLAAIYDRVSKDPTSRRRSVEKQEDANRRACTDNGWAVADDAVYTDNDKSASRFATKKRPNWEQLRQRVGDGRYHVVVLWEVSRGDRDDLGWLGFLHLCRKLGVWIHIESHGHTYDPRKRRDYKTLAEEGLDSADESERISERICGDVAANARRGMPHGPVTYGYRREYEVDAGGIRRITGQHPDEEPLKATGDDGTSETYTTAGVVREICARLLAGETVRAVTADLNARNIPSPRTGPHGWATQTVRAVAIKPAYAGLRAHYEAEFDATWDGLISETDHRTLVARYVDPKRRLTRDTTIKYLGSGLYVCGVCGKPVRPITQYYGKAYTCWPEKLVSRAPRVDRRDVSDAEAAELGALEGAEQVSRILELVEEEQVSQTSIARALKVNRSTLNMRLLVERRRRNGGEPLRTAKAGTAHHVSRNVEDVDAYVQMSVWRRLARPDIAALLAEDEQADKRMAELAAEIAEKQARLDAARDGYAKTGAPSLETVARIEAVLVPEIEKARERMNEARVKPVLAGLVLPSVAEVEAEWWRRSIPQRREVIRVLIERVEILRLRNRKTYTIEESVRIVWRRPRRRP